MTTNPGTRIWRGLGVLAALLGSQSLVAALPQPGNALMLLPSEGTIAGLGDEMRRGFLLAQEQAQLCTNRQTEWSIGWLSPGADLVQQLKHRNLPPLVVAPPAAALVTTGLLAEQRQRQVLLPLQRGLSLQQLATRPGSDRLWPVSASRGLEIDVMVKALLDQQRKRFMVVSDGSADQRQLAERFLETMERQGGKLIGLDPGVRTISSTQAKAADQLAIDVDWFRPDALVVMTTNDSPLMRSVLQQRWPETVQLVWNVRPRFESPVAQIGVAEANRGPGWAQFNQTFQQRFGYAPGMVEAAGYDAGQLVALSVVREQADQRKAMQVFDANSPSQPLCQALKLAAQGEATRPMGASSNMDMKAATPPTAILEVVEKGRDGALKTTTYDLSGG